MPEKNLEAEITIMRKINHPNIVRLIDCIRAKGHVYLIMEYCSLGDLNTYLKDTCFSKGMKESDLIHFLGQIGSALKYLRQHNFVHRDIKPQNILLVPSQHELPTIKISDFGFAKFLPNASLTTSYCGTPLYMAPEVILRKSYDAKADLWSVGVLLYEMMMGKKIFQTNQMYELEEFLRTYKNQVDFSGSTYSFSTELKDLISVLLKKNPHERASCEDFFHHVALLTKSRQEDDDDYVVVIDMKRSSSSDHPYSSSAPSHLNIYTEENDRIRERKFSVGSAGSVLTKALSKAFFGGSHSGSSTNTSSPPSPTTPPIIEEVVVEEMTLNKLLISTPSLIVPTPEYTAFTQKLDHLINMMEAVQSVAEAKINQSIDFPFDFVISQEVKVLLLKVAYLINLILEHIKEFNSIITRKNTELYCSLQLRHKQIMEQVHQLGSDTYVLGVESILYNQAIESSGKADILEVTNENLQGSLHLFQYSVLLLEAMLQVKDKSEISSEDRHIIKKLIRSIHARRDVVINKTNKY